MTRSRFRDFCALLRRHWDAFVIVFTVVIPAILRSGRRPVFFSRWNGMGDIICTLPAALELKKRHPGALFFYNCHPDFAALPRMGGVTGRCMHSPHIGLVGHWYRFLLGGFYHFGHRDDSAAQGGSREPMVAEYCRQFGAPVTDEHAPLVVEPALRGRAKKILEEKKLDPGSFIVIHAGPTWPVREWTAEGWAGLVEGLKAAGFTSVAQLGMGQYQQNQIGAAGHFQGLARITPGGPVPGVVSLVDALSIEETIAVISLARLFVGIDSGLLHLAAATRVPGVGIFGMSSPQYRFSAAYRLPFVVSGVECQGCCHRFPLLHWVTGCPYDIRCMKTIGAGEVLRACLALLAAPIPP